MASPTGSIVGVDCDGVLYRFGAVMRRWLIEHCGIPATQLTEPTTYSLPAAWGLTDDYLNREMIRAVRAGVLFWTGAPYRDALPALRRIAAAGHHVRIITARALPGIEDVCLDATTTWLRNAGFPFHDVVLSRRKHEVDYDILIDDCPDNVATSRAVGRNAVLLDRPWNRDSKDLPVITWPGAADLLTGLGATGLPEKRQAYAA